MGRWSIVIGDHFELQRSVISRGESVVDIGTGAGVGVPQVTSVSRDDGALGERRYVCFERVEVDAIDAKLPLA